MKISRLLITAAILAVLAGPAFAAANLVVNSGFETPDLTNEWDGIRYFGYNTIGTVVNDWTIGGYGTMPDGWNGFYWWFKNNTPDWGVMQVPEGVQCFFYEGNQTFISIAQTIATTPGSTYNVSFAADAFLFDSQAGQVQVKFGNLDETFTTALPSAHPGWQYWSRQVVATDASTELSLQRIGGGSALIDDIRVEEVVARVTGKVNLQDFATGNYWMMTVGIDLSQNGVEVARLTALLDDNGNFASPYFSAGTYDVGIKVGGFLRKVFPAVEVMTPVDLGEFSLINGDVDGDNEITSTDLSILGLGLGIAGE